MANKKGLGSRAAQAPLSLVGGGDNEGDGEGSGNGSGRGQGGSYNATQYIVPGSDHQGHSVRAWCRVQPTVDHEIDAIVASKNWPFRTKGDFIRWAVYEGVKVLEKRTPVPNSMMVVADTIMEQCRATAMWLKFNAVLNETDHTVRELLSAGNEGEALKLLSVLKSHVMKMEEANWRDQWLKEFKQRWGHIWDRQKNRAVSLTDMDKD